MELPSNMITYSQEEVDEIIRIHLKDEGERDLQGQIVIYTNIFQWKNGEFHDSPDPSLEDDPTDA